MTRERRSVAVCVALLCCATCSTAAAAPRKVRSEAVARAPTAAPRAPSGPPLVEEGRRAETETLEPQVEPAAPSDPLVSNGLGSPLCRGALGAAQLAASARERCRTSDFIAAAAPTNGFGIDVHIDTGFLGLSAGTLESAVQDFFVVPVWMALVWSVHALVVMLEWAFALDLLGSPAASGLGLSLRTMQSALTDPWLATVLAIAAVATAYNGLIRRRVAETLGQALAMLLMTAGGLWIIADPRGTVGAVGEFAGEAGLGALAVSAQGEPARPGQALADGMAGLFASVIEVPWCYLEFGDVEWCRTPSRLDGRLRSAALAIAAREAASGTTSEQHSAELLRRAQTNGAFFLALPANGPDRNSINNEGSLLRVLCQSPDATHCVGPTASEAEFRTGGGTWPRVGGILLIVAGALGMLLLVGYIAMRLLTAALLTLLLLLLTPAVVLAPALGESGRSLFRRWAEQLLGNLAAKLLFAFLLGAVLAVDGLLASLTALGWWTQWLLMSAFWWTVFLRRRHAFGLLGTALFGDGQQAAGAGSAPPRFRRRLGSHLDANLFRVDTIQRIRARQREPAPESAQALATLAAIGAAAAARAGGSSAAGAAADAGGRSTPSSPGDGRAPSADGEAAAAHARPDADTAVDVQRVGAPKADGGHDEAPPERVAELGDDCGEGPVAPQQLTHGAGVRAGADESAATSAIALARDRLERLKRERALAEEAGDSRRAARLRLRAERVAGETESLRESADVAAGEPRATPAHEERPPTIEEIWHDIREVAAGRKRELGLDRE